MSCQQCDERQDSGEKIYYRWGKANVEINACDEHFKEIREVLNDHQERLKLKENGDIVTCMGCDRTVPNDYINALVEGDKVTYLCAVCALKQRNEALGVPEDTPFTGSIAKFMYVKTVKYYKETGQS